MAKRPGAANLNPPVRTSEEARALVNRRWQQQGGAQGRTTTSVRVSLPNDLLSAIDESGENRSELITRLLREWAEQRASL